MRSVVENHDQVAGGTSFCLVRMGQLLVDSEGYAHVPASGQAEIVVVVRVPVGRGGHSQVLVTLCSLDHDRLSLPTTPCCRDLVRNKAN